MNKMRLFLKYGQYERNYELVSDVCFSLILVNLSSFLLIPAFQNDQSDLS